MHHDESQFLLAPLHQSLPDSMDHSIDHGIRGVAVDSGDGTRDNIDFEWRSASGQANPVWKREPKPLG